MTRIVGRYEIIRRIGKGGMATVHLARQPDLDRVVALKELDHFGTDDETVFASRFLREARMAGSLKHPNIVTVYEYFEHEARPFIAMEYVEGGSLRDYLGRLSLAQIIGVLEGLLASLTHAERHEIVHRDIKPENILVTEEGRVKITDFGIAKAYNAVVSGSMLTAPGTTIGTPTYMAPEQGTGRPIGHAADLYAVGVVAYEMLVGRVPFDSDENPLAIVWQHVNDPVPDPRRLRPELDPRLCDWLGRLLEKSPSARPASAAAALDELEEIVLDVLGSRWRRGALLPTPKAPDQPPGPLTPPRVDPPSEPPDDARVVDEEVPAMSEQTIPPRALRDRTESFRRGHRPPALKAPDASKRSWTGANIAIVVATMIIAAVAGLAVFAPSEEKPRAPVGPPPPATSAATQRFAADLADMFERLDRLRVPARKELAAANTARRQASRARTIGSAYRAASAALADLAPAVDQRTPAADVRRTLIRAGQAYDALAVAARSRKATAYNVRRRTIETREEAVRRAAARVPGLRTTPSAAHAP